jgi:drug/metabolite transporter (DMT)-like permease
MKPKSGDAFPVAECLLLLVAAFWGTSYGLSKEALVFYSVMGFVAIRFSLTFLCLFPFFIREYKAGNGRDWRVGIPTGCILLAVFVFETYGVLHTSAANAALLISLCVLFTPYTEWLIFNQKPRRESFILAVVSFTGVGLLTISHGMAFNLGDALILVAAVLRAFMVTTTKKLTTNKDISTISLTGIQSGVVAAGALVALWATEPDFLMRLPSSSNFWLIVVYLVVFCTIFAFFVQNYGTRKLSPSKVSLLMGSEPAFGAIFAVWWLGEDIGPLGWFGGSLIVVASLYATLPKTNKTRGAAKNRHRSGINP